MTYDDSRIPRLLPAADTTPVRGLTAQMLVLKIDGRASVGELRSMMRHMGLFDASLEKLIDGGLVELLEPAEPAASLTPADSAARDSFCSEDLGSVLRMLTEPTLPMPGEDVAAFRARLADDPDQPFFPATREALLATLGAGTEDTADIQVRQALNEHSLLGHFRHWLESAIINSSAANAMALISFQRRLDAKLESVRQAHQEATSEVRSD